VWETSASGPFDRWPTGDGFERFYGFIGGETNQWQPTLFDGTERVPTPGEPGYHFSEDITRASSPTFTKEGRQIIVPTDAFGGLAVK
jgi:arylsulfatase A-like enzyme